MRNSIRIFLVDDSLHFLSAALDFLDLIPSFEIVGTETDPQKAVARAIQLQPEIILLDINLGEQSGLELIPSFKKHLPGTKIIVLTIMNNDSYRSMAAQALADAFVRKPDMTNELVSIIFGLMNAPRKEQNHS